MKIPDRNMSRTAALYRMWMRSQMDLNTMVGLGLPSGVISAQKRVIRRLKNAYNKQASKV